MDSILNATKKTLGVSPEYTAFDPDIEMHINAALSAVNQLGVGTLTTITDESTDWSAIGATAQELPLVKTYVYLKTRLGFDPPATSFAIESIQRQITELEFRLSVYREEDQWTDPEVVV